MYTLIHSTALDSTPYNNSRIRNPYENLRLYPLTEALNAGLHWPCPLRCVYRGYTHNRENGRRAHYLKIMWHLQQLF